VTPLHLALNNNRSINIIIYWMSQIDQNASETFKDIWPDLVDTQNFILYLNELPFQTI